MIDMTQFRDKTENWLVTVGQRDLRGEKMSVAAIEPRREADDEDSAIKRALRMNLFSRGNPRHDEALDTPSGLFLKEGSEYLDRMKSAERADILGRLKAIADNRGLELLIPAPAINS